MLEHAPLIAFLPVRDLGAAERFFAGVLGLPVAASDGFALVLRPAPGLMLRCVAVPEFTPQPFTVLGWEHPELTAAAAQLRAAGIEPVRYPGLPQNADGIWTAPGGSEVLWFLDPFGNTLSLSRHP